MTARTITLPADNSALVSSVVRNQLQLLEDEIAAIVPGTGTVTNVSSADANATVATQTTTPVITVVSAPKLQTARTIGGTSFDGTANIAIGALNSTNVGATTSAQLAGVISDETGSGPLVFGTTPTITTPVLNGIPTGTGVSATPTASIIPLFDANKNISANNFLQGYTTTATAGGTTTLTVASTCLQYFTGASAQTIVMPVASTMVVGQSFLIVNASAAQTLTIQSSGGSTIFLLKNTSVTDRTSLLITCILTSGTSTTSWLWIPINATAISGKNGLFNNSLTLAGTDTTTMTFPSTSATIARTDAAQTFTGTQTFSLANTTPQALSVTTNAATADINHGIQNFTNSSAAAMTITLTTTSAVDGQFKEIRIYDFSAVAQGITWVGTENSSGTVPSTSNGSTTSPLSVLFQFNGSTSKWRFITSV